MNAPVDMAASRAERRRQNTITNMQTELRSLVLDLERIRELGNNESAVALVTLRGELSAVHQKAGSLHTEFVELDQEEQQNESCEPGG